MSTYKALVLESLDKPIAVQELPIPTVVPGSVLVNILYSGINSHTRLIFTGKLPYVLTLPQTPGPSGIARVEAVGSDATSLKPGDLVWIDPVVSGRDDPDTQILLGLHGGITEASKKLMSDAWRDGTYGQKALVPLESTFALPPALTAPKAEGGLGYPIKDLATLSITLVPYGGLESAGVGPGTTIIIAPATGKFSGGAVLTALAMGAKVIAASRNEEGLKKLLLFPGAKERLTTVKLESDLNKDTASLMRATGGKGAHVFLDFCPPSAGASGTPTHITAAIQVLKRNGQAILMGGIPSNIEIPYQLLMFKNIGVRGQFMYTRPQIEKYIQLIENGNLVLGEEVGQTVLGAYALEDAQEALVRAEEGAGWGGDVLFAPNGEQ